MPNRPVTSTDGIRAHPYYRFIMRKNRSKRKQVATPRRRQPMARRFKNNYLKGIRIPVRVSIPWKRTKGTTGKWSFAIKLSELVKNFTSTYDEFKVLRLSCRWFPNNSTSSLGLCAAVLMDQNGFGEFGNATGEAWFTTISSMPGSYVGNRHTSFALHWKPTEPDARQWRSYQRSETGYVICHFYMADNGAEDSETGGIILVTGLAMGRGTYYNAQVARLNIASMLQDYEIE